MQMPSMTGALALRAAPDALGLHEHRPSNAASFTTGW
jgi:hypothetical protein